jgi:hypothetical protein
MRTLAVRALQRSTAARAVNVRYVNTSVVRSEKAERRDHGEASLHAQDGARPLQTQAMKSNKGEMEVYDFYTLAKVFQGETAKRHES